MIPNYLYSLPCLILAQAETMTTLAGGAGWVGAGLLGLVLGWLLFVHLPAKDKQLKEMIDGKDSILRAITTEHTIALDKARLEFREWLQIISNNNAASVKALTDAIAKDMMVFNSSIQALDGTIRSLTNK